MTKSNKDLALYRLQRAHETLEDARILADAGRWNPCVNRLYYACFYAVSALLVREGLSSSKHTGLRSLFNQRFVKTNKVPKEKARIYNDLFERRQEGDYVDFIDFDESQVLLWFPEAESFVENIALLIEKDKE
jgi:uncharacterized protein (UPF0332 family)